MTRSRSDAPSSHCLVVLTDRLYLPGTVRAIESWIRWNGPLPVVALSADPPALDDPRLRRLCERLLPIDPAPYRDIPAYAKRRSQRYAATFLKFEAFGDFGYERTLYLDSDILCLRPAPALLAAPMGPTALLAARETGFRRTRSYKGHPNEINSGVMAIDRPLQGRATIECLSALARESPGRGGYSAGDQGILNKWIHRDAIPLGILPQEYNLIKKDYADEAGLDRCRLLHFADRKPWFPPKGRSGGAVPRPEAPTALERLWLESAHQPARPAG